MTGCLFHFVFLLIFLIVIVVIVNYLLTPNMPFDLSRSMVIIIPIRYYPYQSPFAMQPWITVNHMQSPIPLPLQFILIHCYYQLLPFTIRL